MEKYQHKQTEAKWQQKWEEMKLYRTGEDKNKPKFYILDMFPYPSGEGLHIGHPKGYSATDIFGRMKTMQGFNVLHPMGWDAFGLPAENYALKHGVQPKVMNERNIANFKRQIKSLGFTYDWEREINTTDPEYYKWTQWIFLQMFKKGLAFESSEPIIWCPGCKTGLAQEDLENGRCERCDSEVERKPMRQWVLRITDYADKMLADLDKLPDWEDSIKDMQRNWIGRSEGAEVEFGIRSSRLTTEEKIKVFTTRPDTLFGCTYAVLAPEHPLVSKITTEEYRETVEQYIKQAGSKSDLERTELQKDKTGVFTGAYAINPVNNEQVPVWIADYVMMSYGTGAIMSVPAHDERDFIFAKKYGIEIKQVVAPTSESFEIAQKVLTTLDEIKKASDTADVKFWVMGGLACAFNVGFIYRNHDDIDLFVANTEDLNKLKVVLEILGCVKIDEKQTEKNIKMIYRAPSGVEIEIGFLASDLGVEIKDIDDTEKTLLGVSSRVMSHKMCITKKEEYIRTRDKEKDKIDLEYLHGKVFSEYGIAVNSDFLDGLTTENAKSEMIKWLEEKSIGKGTVNYKLKDWVFSRQRYWGEPIPIIHCEKCGAVGVPEKDLPVILPEVERYEPSGTGESPLVNIDEWVNTTCPECGGPGKRETNTMPQWAGSSWYHLRYMDANNKNALVDKDIEKYWAPVDFYVGGAEHATRHLIYVRFWHKFLFDIGVVSTEEPFRRLQHVGLVLAEDGRKMSKRWGNVINPDEVVQSHGADAVRMYEMFMGPFNQACAWSSNGLTGVRKFLDKIWQLQEKVSNEPSSKEILNLLHKTIKKVGQDIEEFKLNTPISQMMIMTNKLMEQEKINKADYEKLLLVLSPYAPHITEEIWQSLGHTESIFREEWPQFDPALIKDDVINLVLQVNGKVRDTVEALADISEEDAKKLALSNDKVIKWMEGKEAKKIVYVSGRLVSIVV